MPVRRVGKGCYQWGHHGKVYCGPGARAKAERQGRAAYSHGYRGREMRESALPHNAVKLHVSGANPYLFDLDPYQLIFTETGQSSGPYLGDPNDPILAFENARGIHVIDGHHRTLLARRENRPVRGILVPETVYRKMLVLGIHPSDMTREFAWWVKTGRLPSEPVRRRTREIREQSFMPTSPFILAGNKALDAISNLDEVPPGYLHGDALRDAAYRALEAGAEPPLEYIGAGATGIVFCDPRFAFKVARHRRGHTLEDEAEWLETAAGIPEVTPYVAYLERWDPKQRVIVRECVRGDRGTWGGSSKIHALWDQIAPYMLAEGWTMPELKEDSVIFVDGVPKIVDAGMVSRISNRLLGYVEDVLDGRITPDEYEDWSTLAFYVRREFGQKEGLDERRANLILERLYELGARRD